MPSDIFQKYLSEINKAYLRGDSAEHTNRPALKMLIEGFERNKITETANKLQGAVYGSVAVRKGTYGILSIQLMDLF